MNEESWPNFARLIQNIVREGLTNTRGHRKASDFQAASLIKQIRSRYGPRVSVVIDVLVPLCLTCKHFECRWLEIPFPQLPHVLSESWRRDYLEIGIPSKKVTEASKALRNRKWRGPGCYQCGSVIKLDARASDGFFLKTISISLFYSLRRDFGKRPPKWMKDIVLQAYDGKCSGCGVLMTSSKQATFDHIVPFSHSGETDIENLQPKCQGCIHQKAKVIVKLIKHPSLCFPLLPPSDKLLD